MIITAFSADRLSAAKFAITVPWNESLKHTRKAYSCTLPSLVTVTSSAVAEPDATGILFAFATGISALKEPEVAGPSIATTLSCVINLFASVVASAGSDLLSYLTGTIFLPFIPPALFNSSIANSIPSTELCQFLIVHCVRLFVSFYIYFTHIAQYPDIYLGIVTNMSTFSTQKTSSQYTHPTYAY